VKGHVDARWEGAILVCGKCSKKVGGGFGPKGRTPLAKALRDYLGLKKGRRASLGVVEVKCLGVCPKDAVVVLDAARPQRWLLARPGADVDALAAELVPAPAEDQAA
jgi:predicted metal-binding protein